MAYVYQINHRKSFFENIGVTTRLIFLDVVLFFVSLVLINIYGEDFFSNYLAITPSLILQGKSLWTFFTSMFFHAGFFHLFANMFSLFFIGNFLERIVGKKRFFWIYIFSGLLGGVFFVASGLIFNDLNVPAVGASGAIFGLLGVLAVLVPYSRIYLLVGPLILLAVEFILGPFIPASFQSLFGLVVNILFFVMLFAMLSFNPRMSKFAVPLQLPMWLLPIVAIVPLVLIDLIPGINLPIGNSAHLGGLIFGLIYGFYLRNKFPKKTIALRNYFR
ncbi:MAG: rhomboid family intramembrane serine protease [Candidatus Pacearchaeota archaeon]